MYFLDTNTCIYFLNGTYEPIKTKILDTPPNDINIPSIVKAELLLCAYKSIHRKSTLEKVEYFLEPFAVIPFTDQMTYTYAETRSYLEKTGKIIGPNDLFIASIVQYCKGILVTNNTTEFKRVKNLKCENWIQ